MSNIDRLRQILSWYETQLKSLRGLRLRGRLDVKARDKVLADLAFVIYDLEHIAERRDGYDSILMEFYGIRERIRGITPTKGDRTRHTNGKKRRRARSEMQGEYIRVYLGGAPGLGKRN